MSLLEQTQGLNPFTWDINLNPAAWWLSLADINSAASIELKSSIYAGNANLTADQYREVQSLVQTKYSGVDYTGMIKGGGMIQDISMTGRDPGLYMNQERLGYWKNDTDQWQSYIANNGNFAFQWDASNYISWNGSELVIRWSIFLEDGTSITDMNNTFYQASAPTVFTDGDIWFDTDDGNKMYLSVASTWTSVQDTLAIGLANTAQTTADGKATVYYQTTAPVLWLGDVWDLWIDTDAGNRLATWNWTAWISASNADAIQALADAASAQSTADGKIKSFYETTAPISASEWDIWFDIDDGNKIYTYRTGAWVATQDSLIGQAINDAQSAQTTADWKATVYYQTTAPTLTLSDVGDLWVDTDWANKVTTWNGTAWIDVSNTDAITALANAATAQATADGKIVTFYEITAPDSASEWDIWFDTDDGNKMYTYRSTVWTNTQDTAIGDAITAAAWAQSTADGKVTTFYLPTSTPPTAEGVGDLWYNTTTNIITRWSGSAWQDIRDIGATKADTALDSSSRYTKWLESNLISETKVKTGYTWVILDNEWIGWYTAGVATFRVDRLTWNAFFSWEITAGGLDVGTAGNIRGWQTAYNTWTWFFLGYSGAAHKFSIGNGTKWMTWDWTNFNVRWILYAEWGTFTGSISSTAGLDIWSAWNIKGWQTAYNTGTWFWLWDDGGTKKFSIGNGTNSLTWNGSVLWIAGNITSTAIITWGTLQTASSWARVVLWWSTLQSIDATGNLITINASNNQIGFQTWADTWYLRFRVNTWVANLETDAIFRSYAAIYCSGLSTGQIDASGIINANFKMKLPVWSNLY